MRIVLVGTDLAPVRDGAGALETLLCGWATGLAAAHDVTVVSVARATTPSAVATPARDTPGGRSAAVAPAPPYRRLTIEDPDDLRSVVTRARPDVVVLNNRPGWQVAVDAPTLHLFHNWPDAWGLPGGADAGADQPDEVLRDMLAGASVAAVSRSLAGEVARVLGRPPAASTSWRPGSHRASSWWRAAGRPVSSCPPIGSWSRRASPRWRPSPATRRCAAGGS